MGYGSYGGFAPYVSKAEKLIRAEKARVKLMKKKGVVLDPVVLDGNIIARSWWGKSWNSNMERYADYAYRLDRGRSYVRTGSVIDLKIISGEIHALVMGSDPSPYTITIKIDTLNKNVRESLMEISRKSLDSMQALLKGEFPTELKDVFFTKGTGLFPSPKEIHFNCSCPDIASMCKHVAAAMYGVSVHLDKKPELFFLLRGIQIDDFVNVLIEKERDKVLNRAELKSERDIVADSDELSELFGIEMDSPLETPVNDEIIVEKKIVVKKAAKKNVSKTEIVGNVVKKMVKKVKKKAASKKRVKKVHKAEESS